VGRVATITRRPAARKERLVHRYVALGDSFTAGATDGPRETWADLVAARLRAANPRCEYRNLAAYGASSEDVLERQLGSALAYEPDLATIECGANDVLLSVRPDVDACTARLETVFARLRSAVPGLAMVTCTFPDLTRFLPLRRRSAERVARGVRELNESIASLAVAHDVLCLEFGDDPQTEQRSIWATDGYHPSPAGHRHAALRAARGLRERFAISIATEKIP
jgi:lysophospholipase L1-like esterase